MLERKQVSLFAFGGWLTGVGEGDGVGESVGTGVGVSVGGTGVVGIGVGVHTTAGGGVAVGVGVIAGVVPVFRGVRVGRAVTMPRQPGVGTTGGVNVGG
jgi:hypothetical protein